MKILHESGDYFVTQANDPKNGYEVYKNGCTHSTRCAIIGFVGDKGLQRAIMECERRAGL